MTGAESTSAGDVGARAGRRKGGGKLGAGDGKGIDVGGAERMGIGRASPPIIIPRDKLIMVKFIVHSLANVGNTVAMILPPLCARETFLQEVHRAWDAKAGEDKRKLNIRVLAAADDKFLFVDRWITKPAVYLLAWLGRA